MRSKKLSVEEMQAIRETWERIPPEAVPEKDREKFQARIKAVDMYIDGAKVKDIERVTHICMSNLTRLVSVCFKMDEFGLTFGYKALIPNKTKIRYTKNADSDTTSGLFDELIRSYPELHDYLIGNYFGDKKYTTERNMNFTTLHHKFLKKCMELGIQDHEYPLNTSNGGYVSMIAFVRKEAGKDINKAAVRENKDNKQKLRSTGIGDNFTVFPIAPYNIVQLDGHKLDFGYIVEIDNGDGTIGKKMATRAWLIAVIDVATRCVLGYSMSQEMNYNQYDVMSAFQNSMTPHQKLALTIPGLRYPENGGFPSETQPKLGHAMIDIIMMDNAKAHLAQNTVNKLVSDLGCTLNFGSVCTPETRGIVERFFGTLETRGFHRLPGTTGSNPFDTKRKNPQREVVKYDITFDEIVQLMDVLIAKYNNTPHSSLRNETPLECMYRKTVHSCLRPTIANEHYQDVIRRLTYQTRQATVRGGNKSGRRPYIQFMNARYRNDVLASNSSYIGEKLTIEFDPNDVSTVNAYMSDGTPLGTLKAMGYMGKSSHSLKTRKNASKLARERDLLHNDFYDPISAYEEDLKKRGKTSRRAATRHDIVRREMGKPLISEEMKNESDSADMIAIDFEEANNSSPSTTYTDFDSRADEDLTSDEYYDRHWGRKKLS